jgi:hypothetical protein
LQVEIETVAEEIAGDMLCDTVDKLVDCLQWVHKVEGSHTEQVYTWRPHANKLLARKFAFIHVSHASVS